MVKIRLLMDIPVQNQKQHGLTKGRVLEAEEVEPIGRNGICWIVKSDLGETVSIIRHEAEVAGEEASDE